MCANVGATTCPMGASGSFCKHCPHLEQVVTAERLNNDAERYPRMVYEWWKFWNSRPAMRKAIARIVEALVTTRASDVGLPVRVPRGKRLMQNSP